jgi:hypothetical protein
MICQCDLQYNLRAVASDGDAKGFGTSEIDLAVCSPTAHAREQLPLFAIQRAHGWAAGNNNNTFTWSGPSAVLDYTGQRPGGLLRGGASQCDCCRAVPLNLLTRV